MGIVTYLLISVWMIATIWDSGWWCNDSSTTDSWMADHHPSQPTRWSGSTRLVSSGRCGNSPPLSCLLENYWIVVNGLTLLVTISFVVNN